MPSKVCLQPSCPRLAVPGKSMCAVHAAEQRKRNRSPNDGFYSSRAWRLSRRKQLFHEPLCEHVDQHGNRCFAIAEHVHHRIPIEQGGAKRDPSNLVSVCASCHTKIHRRMAGRSS